MEDTEKTYKFLESSADDGDSEREKIVTNAEKYYNCKGNKIKVLMAMTVGIDDVDYTVRLEKITKKRKEWNPKRQELRDEVIRRLGLIGDKSRVHSQKNRRLC